LPPLKSSMRSLSLLLDVTSLMTRSLAPPPLLDELLLVLAELVVPLEVLDAVELFAVEPALLELLPVWPAELDELEVLPPLPLSSPHAVTAATNATARTGRMKVVRRIMRPSSEPTIRSTPRRSRVTKSARSGCTAAPVSPQREAT